MSLEIWITFVLAAMVILIIPGPTIILVISHAVARGRKAVLPLTIGVTLGDFTAMTLSLLGLGAVIASSASLFVTLKWIGAVYLIYIGINLWRSNPEKNNINPAIKKASRRSLCKSAFIVTALNPKSIAFFVAFLPQFISTQAAPFPQFLILGSTFLCLAAVNAALYGFFAGQLRDMMQNKRALRLFNRCGGMSLISAGVLTAALQRAS